MPETPKKKVVVKAVKVKPKVEQLPKIEEPEVKELPVVEDAPTVEKLPTVEDAPAEEKPKETPTKVEESSKEVLEEPAPDPTPFYKEKLFWGVIAVILLIIFLVTQRDLLFPEVGLLNLTPLSGTEALLAFPAVLRL